jgi:hypothetical protein
MIKEKWPEGVIAPKSSRKVKPKEEGYYWYWDIGDEDIEAVYKKAGSTFFSNEVYLPVDPSIIPEKPKPIKEIEDGIYKLQWKKPMYHRHPTRYLEKREGFLYELDGSFYMTWDPKKCTVLSKLVEEEIETK